jgi:hypothetical protein
MLCHQQLVRMRKRRAKDSSSLQFLQDCVHWFKRRYWRLWPQVCILSVIAHALAILVPMIARDYFGKPDVKFHENCLNRTALVFETLLVNNLTQVGRGICEGRIWFLMILIDFTVLTPLFVYLFEVARRPMLVASVAVFVLSYSVRVNAYQFYFNSGAEHISSWFIGIFLSEALFVLQRSRASSLLPQIQPKDVAAHEQQPTPTPSSTHSSPPSRRLLVLAWFVVVTVCALSVFILSTAPGNNDLLYILQYRFKVTVERLFTVPFCASIAVLVYMCELVPTSYVARFLSHRFWTWPAELCYEAYLVGTPAGALGAWLVISDLSVPTVSGFVRSLPVQWLCAWAIAYILNRGAALFRFIFERLFAWCFTPR